MFLLSKFNEIDFYIVIIFIFGSINLWRDFETVNYIVIDIKEKVIVIHSKNIIKALLFKKKKILFSDILSISNIEKSAMRTNTRYVLRLNLVKEDSAVLTDFSNSSDAELMSLHLNAIIKNSK